MYGMGNMGGNFMNLVFMMWIVKCYSPPAGEGVEIIPVAWLGYAMLAGRIMDAVADPLIGYWSDNANTRWGRRIPFLMFGGLPMCLVFFLMWAPPVQIFTTPVSMYIYLCVLMAAFWFLFTVVLCPYLALLPEIAVSTEDRVNLAVYQSVFLMASSGIIMGASPVLKEKLGFPAMGAVFAVLALIAVYAPVFAVRERYKPKGGKPEYGLITSLMWSYGNKPFMVYLLSSVFAQLGFNIIIASLAIIVTVILKKSDSFTAVILGGSGLFAVVTFLFMNKLCARFDKRRVYLAGMLSQALLLPLVWVFGQYDVTLRIPLGQGLVLSEVAIAFLVFSLTGFSIASIMVLPMPILSDIIDLDELKTGERREAMYFGAQGFLQKLGAGLSGIIMTQLFSRFGYSARLQTVHREDNQLYYDTIDAFRKKTGCPVIINTSFNVRGEPIVCTPEHAYTCFMRTEMDYLFVGNFLLDKKKQPAFNEDKDWRQEFELD